jgi:hypothetical protein
MEIKFPAGSVLPPIPLLATKTIWGTSIALVLAEFDISQQKVRGAKFIIKGLIVV